MITRFETYSLREANNFKGEVKVNRKFTDEDPYGEEDWLAEAAWNPENIKKGDMVICLKKSNYHFTDIPNNITPGKKYKVLGFISGFVRIRDDNGKVNAYSLIHFTKYQEKYDNYFKKLKIIRDKMKDVDPLGEENWLAEAQMKFKKLRLGSKYEVGDIVYYRFDPTHMAKDQSGYYEIYKKYETLENWPYVWSYDLRQTVKPSGKIAVSDNDPYGEEDWFEDDSTKGKAKIILHASEEDLFRTKEEWEAKRGEAWRWPKWDVFLHDRGENVDYKFRPGDDVVVNANAAIPRIIQVDRNEYEEYDQKEFVGKAGVIIAYAGHWEPKYLVHFDHKFTKKQYGGWGGSEDPSKCSAYFEEKCLDFKNK
jgi:hypothetical protein